MTDCSSSTQCCMTLWPNARRTQQRESTTAYDVNVNVVNVNLCSASSQYTASRAHDKLILWHPRRQCKQGAQPQYTNVDWGDVKDKTTTFPQSSRRWILTSCTHLHSAYKSPLDVYNRDHRTGSGNRAPPVPLHAAEFSLCRVAVQSKHLVMTCRCVSLGTVLWIL